jgi:dihydropteroate synthase
MAWCRSRGATIFRVHDVGFLGHALVVADALATGAPERWHDVPK